MRLSQIVCRGRKIDPPKGTRLGKCCFCSTETTKGHEAAFGENFCNASLLSGGMVVCPECQHMLDAGIVGGKQSRGKMYRSNMWWANMESFGIIRFPRKEGSEPARDLGYPVCTPREILVEPPDPPFVVYLTRTWKKTGWQALMRLNGGVGVSRERFPVGMDYDPVLVDRTKLISHLEDVDLLRSHKVTKEELSHGYLRATSIGRLLDAGQDVPKWSALLAKRSLDPMWSLAVYVA